MHARRSLSTTVLLAAVGLLAALLPGGASEATPQRLRAGAVAGAVFERIDVRKGEVKSFWTPRRMRRAEPRDLTLESHPRIARSQAAADSLGEPVSVPAARPATASSTMTRLSARSTEASQSSGAGPIPYTREEVTDTAGFPSVTHGKLFFSGSSGSFVCSGTVVSSVSKDVVWTAGHCVHEGKGGGFFDNFKFVPGYRNGTAPKGEWFADGVFTSSRWATNTDPRHDVGALTMAPNGGQEIADVVGSRGIRFNQPANQSYGAYGHPAAPPFDGERMFRCDSQLGGFDEGLSAPKPMAIGCDMTGGSSGGGWIVGGEFVQSVNSYGLVGLDEVLFGPQLRDVALGVYELAGGEVPEDETPPRITRLSDRPDPFSPNGDGRKDRTRIKFRVNEPVKLLFTIKNKRRKTVYKISVPNLSAGAYFIIWRGRHFKTNRLVKRGRYAYRVRAVDAAGNRTVKAGRSRVKR